MSDSLSITFARGARRVTGSNFLFEAKRGEKTVRILVDCGLSQGEHFAEDANSESFSYDPKSVDAIFFTHAHADHIGLFPRLVKDGFKGKAYATEATKALIPVMLEDSVHLMSEEAKRTGREPIYGTEDVTRAAALIQPVRYHDRIEVALDVSVTFYNAGHILGSALLAIDAYGKRTVFTGDLGRVPSILVPDREVPENVDYLVTESVYGNRKHGSIEESESVLLSAAKETAARGGTLLIPSFSLERTQIILSLLDRAMSDGRIPQIKTFMDSPLAAEVTRIYRSHPEYLREDIRKRLEGGDDPFAFPSLTVTERNQESHAIDSFKGAKIILAGAGMSHGGRIRRHEARYLGDTHTMLMFVGYQVPGSLGRRIMDGGKKVQIDGQNVTVRAHIVKADGFSAHADRDDLLSFAEKTAPRRAFVVLGETEAASFLAQRISGFLGIPVDVPREGEKYDLN